MIFSLSFKRFVIAIVYNNVKKVEIMSFREIHTAK